MGREKLSFPLGNLPKKSMLQQSWRQSQLQVEEPQSVIKQGGPGKSFISTWEFT
jgi:hypothetical protein